MHIAPAIVPARPLVPTPYSQNFSLSNVCYYSLPACKPLPLTCVMHMHACPALKTAEKHCALLAMLF